MTTSPANKEKIDVIIVDDEYDLCFMMQAILKSKGLVVMGLTDAGELDSLLKHFEAKLLILDLQLDKHDGATICKELLSEKKIPLTKVLIVSASHDGVEKSEQSGADDFLSKPFGIKEFQSKVMDLILNQQSLPTSD